MLIQLPDYFELHNEKTNCSNFGFPLSEKKKYFPVFWLVSLLLAGKSFIRIKK